MKQKKQLNNILENIIKSQIGDNNNCINIKKGTKGLLSDNFKKNDKKLPENFKKKESI